MKNKVGFLIGFFAFCIIRGCFPQNNDAQFWENLYFERNLTPRLFAHINQQGRISDNFSRFRYAYLDGGLTYNFFKPIRFSADYVFVLKKQYNNRMDYRHQYYFALSAKKKIKPFTFYLREMFQIEYNNYFTSENGIIPSYYFRTKATAKLKEKELGKFTPYAATEIYFDANRNQKFGSQVDRLRYFLGTFYNLSGINALEYYYMIENNIHTTNQGINWVVGIGLEHTFY